MAHFGTNGRERGESIGKLVFTQITCVTSIIIYISQIIVFIIASQIKFLEAGLSSMESQIESQTESDVNDLLGLGITSSLLVVIWAICVSAQTIYNYRTGSDNTSSYSSISVYVFVFCVICAPTIMSGIYAIKQFSVLWSSAMGRLIVMFSIFLPILSLILVILMFPTKLIVSRIVGNYYHWNTPYMEG